MSKRRAKVKTVYKLEDVEKHRIDFLQAIRDWGRYETAPMGNPYQAIKVLVSIIQRAMPFAVMQGVLIKDMQGEMLSLRADEDFYPNNGLAWSPEEEELLIQERANGESIERIARNLCRKPAAVATRLSVLVGIPREIYVERYISGELDGSEVEGFFAGKMSGAS